MQPWTYEGYMMNDSNIWFGISLQKSGYIYSKIQLLLYIIIYKQQTYLSLEISTEAHSEC